MVSRIEDFPAGYPRFTALISANRPYVICRRFTQVRARLLLLKQDRVAQLEEKLQRIDATETRPLFLGKTRGARNSEREIILTELDEALVEYDYFMQRACRADTYLSATSRDVTSLQNWLIGNGCIAREEWSFLYHERDLVSLSQVEDGASQKLEIWIEGLLYRLWRGFRDHCQNGISADPNVYIHSSSLVRKGAGIVLLMIITTLLMVPVVLCNMVGQGSAQLVIITISTISHLVIVSSLNRPKTMELILAAATYATLLTVFISGGNP